MGEARVARAVTTFAQATVPLPLVVLLVLDIARNRTMVIAAGCGVIMLLWTLNSTVNNIWLLQGRRLGTGAVAAALSLSLLSAATTTWAISSGISARDQPRSPGQGVVATTVALVIAAAVVTLLGGAGGVRLSFNTELPPWRGLVQDGLSMSAIVLIIVFPIAYTWSATDFWRAVGIVLPVITLFTFPFLWIMKANRDHPEIEARRQITPAAEAELLVNELREHRSLAGDQQRLIAATSRPCAPNSAEFIRILAAHTRNQNRIAATMLLIPLAPALTVLVELIRDDESFRRWIMNLMRPRSSS